MRDARKHGYLYVIRSSPLPAIKVGFATSPSQRLASLQTGNPNKLFVHMIVPVEQDAERVFHEVMRPHRLQGEWYPDDALMLTITENLIEHWGDKVQETNDGSHSAWIRDGDEWENPLAVHLNAKEMRSFLDEDIAGYFAMSEEDWDGLVPAPIVNHWAPVSAVKARKLRPGYT